MRVCSHVELDAIIATIKGKHRITLERELRLAFTRYMRVGYFMINHDVFDFLYTRHCRSKLMEILARCSKVVRGHRRNSSIRRAFTFSGITKNRRHITYRLALPRNQTSWHTIPADWLMGRCLRWCAYCEANGLPQKVDIDGSTTWGRAAFETLGVVEIPTVSVSPRRGQAAIRRLTQRGVLRMVWRKHGRMYHALTGFAKADRQRILIAGQPVIEVDMSACYTALLASALPAEDRQPIVDKLRAGTWYRQFDSVYAEFARAKREEMLREGATKKEISKRLKGVKVEFQRQCLFWSDARKESRPLFGVLRQNHPALANLIEGLRAQHSASELSSLLTHREGKLFVDTVIPALYEAGIPALGIHDGLVVPVEDAEATRAILERASLRQLGFVPGVSIKR